MQFSLRWGAALQTLVALLLGLLLGSVAWKLLLPYTRGVSIAEHPLQYGSRLEVPVPDAAQLDPSQELALIVGVSDGSPLPEYIGVLHRRYAQRGLRVLAVLPPHANARALQLAKAAAVPFLVDENGAFQNFLHYSASHPHGAVLIYGPDYKVKFHLLQIPDNDLLRQLVEKYLLGSISYTLTEALTSSLLGQRLDGLRCGSDVESAAANRIFIVFPPGCSACELNNYRIQLSAARKLVVGGGVTPNRWTVVFLGGRDASAEALAQSLSFQASDVCTVRESLALRNLLDQINWNARSPSAGHRQRFDNRAGFHPGGLS